MTEQNICPSLINGKVINETTTMVPTDTTTMKFDTTTRGVKFNKWKQNAVTIVGTNEDKQNHLYSPHGIFLDKNQNLFFADAENHRIIQWKPNENQGKIVAGGNGKGKRIDQLNYPTDVIVDEENNSLIIADFGNNRITQWSLNQNQQEILIENMNYWSLTKDKYKYLYVSNWGNNEVRRWKIGEIKGKEGQLVAGGNGQGNQLNQLNGPTYIFIDDQQSIYISDSKNHRVMKWKKDAKEGIVVVGGTGQGSQLNEPKGIIVDEFDQIYVVDEENHRIMRWIEGEGEIIVGGNGKGTHSNQLNRPTGLTIDLQGNLHVVDWGNHRIQRFDLISEEKTV
ncbi:unnamed protein product [Adineta ricciae]|uniref:Uncharacterized protein n=2 Tax=Adineta ricciae TaxID=249248 RepID=A0A815J9B2_ADIRI|nr:unnamed protein product [Adineta ricciae]